MMKFSIDMKIIRPVNCVVVHELSDFVDEL